MDPPRVEDAVDLAEPARSELREMATRLLRALDRPMPAERRVTTVGAADH